MERRNQKLMEEYNKSLLAWDTRPPLAAPASSEGTEEIRRGPWTVDEDLLLINYVAQHGQGRWNALARSAGLKRTGKSCRFRWLNYLRPGVRRGNITLEEQLLILELHSRWGNRWSKIARFLPGRTDNEIKNYWRTRVQKHAKQLRCDDAAGSIAFMDGMRRLWMQAASSASASTSAGLLVYPCTPKTMTGTTMVNSGSSSEEYYFSPPPPPPPPQQLSSLGSNVIGLEEEIAGARGIDALLGGGGEWTERHVDFPGNTYVGGDWPWSIDCLWSDMQII